MSLVTGISRPVLTGIGTQADTDMEVHWSPNHEDKFYTFGNDLSLYKVSNIAEESAGIKENGQF